MSSPVQHSVQDLLGPIDTQAELLNTKQQEKPASITSTGAKYLLARFFNVCTFEKIGFFRNWENESARNLVNAVKASIGSVMGEKLQNLRSSVQGLPGQLRSACWDPMNGALVGRLIGRTPLGNLGQMGDDTTRFVVGVIMDVAHAGGEVAENAMDMTMLLLGTAYQENNEDKRLMDACKKLAFDKIFSSDFVLGNVLSVDKGEASVMQRFIGWLCSTSLVRNVADHLVTEHILNNSNNNLQKNRDLKLFHEQAAAACWKDFQETGGDQLSFSNLKRLFSTSNENLPPIVRQHVVEFNRLQEALSNNLVMATIGNLVRTNLPSREQLSGFKCAFTDVLENPNPKNYQNLASAFILLLPQGENLSKPVQDKIAALAVPRMQGAIKGGNMDSMRRYLLDLAHVISDADEVMQEITRACSGRENGNDKLVQSLTPRLQSLVRNTYIYFGQDPNLRVQQDRNRMLTEGIYVGGSVGFSQLNLLADNPEREEKLRNLLENSNAESIIAACLDLTQVWVTTTRSVQKARDATHAVVDVVQTVGNTVVEAAKIVGSTAVGMAQGAVSVVVDTARAVGQVVANTIQVASSGIQRLFGEDSGEDVSAIDDALAPEVAAVQESFHELIAPPLQQVVGRQKLEDGLNLIPRNAAPEVVRRFNSTEGTKTVFQDKGWTWTATYNVNPSISQALSGNALALTHQGNVIEGRNVQEKLRNLQGILAQGSNNDATQGIALLSNIIGETHTLLPSNFQEELDAQELSVVTHFQDGSPASPSFSLNITNVVYGFEAFTLAAHEDNVSCQIACEYPIQTRDGQLTGERVRISFDVNLYDTPTFGRVGSTRSFNINDMRNFSSVLVGS
ncbi:MAG: hypothetical protein LBJ78_02840 [Puniceicoccales bacterium]|jgi:hypothetical protein|nr:hypothetical protein [Puniceicoccales bacterium]